MNKQEFNGKTLDEALAAAARAFGTDVTLLSYNILPQSAGGLFSKLFQRGVRLEAWVDDKNDVQAAAREAVRQAMSGAQAADRPQPRERKSAEPARPARPAPADARGRNKERDRNNNASGQPSRRQGPGRNPIERDARPQPRREQPEQHGSSHEHDTTNERHNRPRLALTSEESKNLLIELAQQFAKGFDAHSNANPQLQFLSDEEVIVSVTAPNLEELLVKSDRLSCAFEHLFKRIAQKRFADVSGRVILNAGSAAQQREDKLRDMALDVAAKVKENGKTITLSSKSSQERRVIHLALENMEGIATKSVGVGENRKLIVYSTTRPPRNKDHQRRERSNQGGERGGNMMAAGNDSGEGARQHKRSRRRGRRGGQRQGGAPRENNQAQGFEKRGPEHDADSDKATIQSEI